jgi:hypothetical protein
MRWAIPTFHAIRQTEVRCGMSKTSLSLCSRPRLTLARCSTPLATKFNPPPAGDFEADGCYQGIAQIAGESLLQRAAQKGRQDVTDKWSGRVHGLTGFCPRYSSDTADEPVRPW